MADPSLWSKIAIAVYNSSHHGEKANLVALYGSTGSDKSDMLAFIDFLHEVVYENACFTRALVKCEKCRLYDGESYPNKFGYIKLNDQDVYFDVTGNLAAILLEWLLTSVEQIDGVMHEVINEKRNFIEEALKERYCWSTYCDVKSVKTYAFQQSSSSKKNEMAQTSGYSNYFAERIKTIITDPEWIEKLPKGNSINWMEENKTNLEIFAHNRGIHEGDIALIKDQFDAVCKRYKVSRLEIPKMLTLMTQKDCRENIKTFYESIHGQFKNQPNDDKTLENFRRKLEAVGLSSTAMITFCNTPALKMACMNFIKAIENQESKSSFVGSWGNWLTGANFMIKENITTYLNTIKKDLIANGFPAM